ncbi:hypothetical protein [Paraburkholderia silvatlantica]|uniref:hypothetical protein n=1 Tax=Paraburkholderia silvatlantica TaxID=321895 RepID=UPI0037536EC5
MGRTAAKIAAEVAQIDNALTALDELLNLLQPPHTGKIRIEWWERNGRRVTTLRKMREQALAPVAMFQKTTAGTLNTNVHRPTVACIGIDLAMRFAR